MQPTVGRMVYYKSFGTPGGEHPSVDRAAVVTQVHNATCIDLCVLNPTGLFFNQSVVQGPNPGQWDWMPFQKGQAAKTEELEEELKTVKQDGGSVGLDPNAVYPFGGALQFLKSGRKVARKGWNGKGMWLVLVPSDSWGMNSVVPFDWGHTDNHLKPWIGMKTADNGFVPWLASQTDILAEDWEIV